MIEFIQNHYQDMFLIIGYIVSIASIIVLITPTEEDNKIFYKIINVLSKISIFNTYIDKKIIEEAKKNKNDK